MEEDVLGPRSEITGATYVLCARCGRAYPERQMVPAEVGALEAERSEYQNLCHECLERVEGEAEVPASALPEEAVEEP